MYVSVVVDGLSVGLSVGSVCVGVVVGVLLSGCGYMCLCGLGGG